MNQTDYPEDRDRQYYVHDYNVGLIEGTVAWEVYRGNRYYYKSYTYTNILIFKRTILHMFAEMILQQFCMQQISSIQIF